MKTKEERYPELDKLKVERERQEKKLTREEEKKKVCVEETNRRGASL